MIFRCGVSFALLFGLCPHLYSATLERTNSAMRVQVQGTGSDAEEMIFVKVGASWEPALSVTSSALHIRTSTGTSVCTLAHVSRTEDGLLLAGACGIGEFEQRIALSIEEEDVLAVSTKLMLRKGVTVNSV